MEISEIRGKRRTGKERWVLNNSRGGIYLGKEGESSKYIRVCRLYTLRDYRSRE